ncbi:MAG: EAL domain-containing protein [Sphaerochaetaceae bacterium]|nr:EAL domain-containing protein [Spirochaetales bacterium]MDY5499141.1 EAL domain-containing protein [Sphaerochaetaceae bacterium]
MHVGFWLNIASLGMMAVLYAVYLLRATPFWHSSKVLAINSLVIMLALVCDLSYLALARNARSGSGFFHLCAIFLFYGSMLLHVLYVRELLGVGIGPRELLVRTIPFAIGFFATLLLPRPLFWHLTSLDLVLLGYYGYGWYLVIRYQKNLNNAYELPLLLIDLTVLTLSLLIQARLSSIRFIGFVHSFSIMSLFLAVQSPEQLIDGQTRLPNRLAFIYRTRDITRRHKHRLFVVTTLADYEELDSLLPTGMMGDIVSHIGHVIKRCSRYGNLYRVNNQQFIVLMDHPDPDSVREVTQLCLSAFSDSFSMVRNRLPVVGFVTTIRYPDDFTTTEDCFLALRQLRSRTSFSALGNTSASVLRTGAVKRRIAVAHLARDMGNNVQMRMRLIPAYDTTTKRMHAAKATLLLSNDQLRDATPLEYIPIAQREGTIGYFTDLMVKECCLLVRAGFLERYQMDKITLALSPRQWLQYQLIPRYMRLADYYGIPYNTISFTMPASMYHQRLSVVLSNLDDMHKAGIRLVLTGYGTGYTGVFDAPDIPDTVASFSPTFTTPGSLAKGGKEIIAASMEVMRIMRYAAQVEGVVSQDDADFYGALGVRYLTGPLFGRPILLSKQRGQWNV